MKKVTALVFSLFVAVFSMKAAGEAINDHYSGFYNGSSYIFVEGGIEFSVFPDGQFDFVYLGNRGGSNVNVSINTPNVSINYNSGYNYDAYVQYDDYGAVIQIENVPIYYDQFGRIIQAGSVEIRYMDRRIVRVGGMHIFYNPYGYFSHYTGYISPFYMTYVYRPWHVHYVRPFWNHCVVYDYPYRQYYHPIRYTYAYHSTHYNRGRSNYTNGRRDFFRPGSRIHYQDGRVATNREYDPNRRNTMVDSREVNRGTDRNNAKVADRNSQEVTKRNNDRQTSRGTSVIREKVNTRSSGKIASNQREVTETSTERKVENTRKTVTRTSNEKVWQGRPSASQAKATNSNRTNVQERTSRTKSTAPRNSTIHKSPSRSNNAGTTNRGNASMQRGRG